MFVSFASNSIATQIALDPSAESENLGFWRSIMPFGSEQKAQPTSQAFYEFDQALTAFSALHQAAQIRISDRRQLLALRDEVVDIELTEFLTTHYSLLNELTPYSRTLSFSGDWIETDHYQVNLGPLKAFNSSSRMGRLSADFTLSKGTLSKESAVLTSLISVDMGTLLFKEMLESWEVFHRELERHASITETFDMPWDTSLESDISVFDTRDEQILDKINESAPTVLALINRLVNINNVVDNPVDKFGHRMTRINLLQTINLDTLKSHYKEAYDQYAPVFQHVSFSSQIVTAQGKQIALIHYDADTKVIGFNMIVSEGGIVLTNSAGDITPEIIFPTELISLDYSVKNDIFINIFGLKIYIDQITMNSQYSRVRSAASEQSDVKMALNQLPKIRVEGALLHFVPPWLIDALIPGTIESAITGAFSEAVKGRSGEGAVIVIGFNEDEGQHQLSAELGVELRYRLLQDFAAGIEDAETQDASNKEETPYVFKDLGEAVREDFDALLRRYNMETVGMKTVGIKTVGIKNTFPVSIETSYQ